MSDGRAQTRNLALILLTAILVVNYADRLVFGIVLESIKEEMRLSDTQLGLLTGIAFAAFYATMGIPLARLADRGNRLTVISICTVVWSVAVAFCGLTRNFTQLMVMRMGVAIGEAGCYGPSLSLIADYFPRAERARAVSRYMLGFPIALIITFLAAGWINQLFGWRLTFLVFGIPGLLLGPLAWFVLKDPRRGGSDVQSDEAEPKLALRQTWLALWAIPSFRNLFLCFAVWGFFAQGIIQWQPIFFLRVHGLDTGAMGTWIACVQGVGSLVGTFLGGEIATRYAKNNERLQLYALAGSYIFLGILLAGVYGAPNYYVSFAILAAYAVLSGLGSPLQAIIQTSVPAHARAFAVAAMYLFTNLIGLGLGPLGVGMLSDLFQPSFGSESLRVALLLFCPGYVLCAWYLWRASKTVMADIAETERADSLLNSSTEQSSMAHA